MIWFTVNELSKYLNLKEKTLYYLVGQKNIPHYRIGKIIRFQKDEIDQWISTKRALTRKDLVEKIRDRDYTSHRREPAASDGR